MIGRFCQSDHKGICQSCLLFLYKFFLIPEKLARTCIKFLMQETCASFWYQILQHMSPLEQESPANAKGSARQPWYIVRVTKSAPFRTAEQYQRNLYIVEKYFQCATIPSLTLWVYLHSFSHCSRSNMPTSAKFRENLNEQQFKVIQGR